MTSHDGGDEICRSIGCTATATTVLKLRHLSIVLETGGHVSKPLILDDLPRRSKTRSECMGHVAG